MIILLLLLLYKYYNNELFKNTNNKQKFIIYFRRKHYIPLLLYINIFKKVLEKNNYEYIYIDNINNINLSNKDNIYFLSFGLDMNSNVIKFLIKNNIKTIMINTEHYTLWNVSEIINNLNNKVKLYVLDYNSININNLKKNTNIYYSPLLYNKYLVNTYNLNITNKIEYINKEFDILIYGSINDRRLNIINKLKKKYNVLCINTIYNDFKELCNYINKSKIILNIFQHDFNKAFDYYRMTFLLSNKIFTISEYPSDIDLTIEPNLIDFDKYLIVAHYDNIESTVSKYLDTWNPEEINDIVNKQFNWFSKNKMEDNIITNLQQILKNNYL
jgi:hypothetical protein